MEFSTPTRSHQHLSYSTGINTGVTWSDVFEELNFRVPEIKQCVRKHDSFGLGLQLSTQAVSELAKPFAFAELREFLSKNQCYVHTLKGFNTDLYNWKDPKQLSYHNNLASLFSQIMPPQIIGSLSTVPGAPKAFVSNMADIQQITHHWVSHAEHLIRLERQTGKQIVLAIQPEAMSFLETTQECADFFNTNLFSENSYAQLSKQLDVDLETAEDLLRTHLTICIDISDTSSGWASFKDCISALDSLGISVGKQLLNTNKMFDVDLSSETLTEIKQVLQLVDKQSNLTRVQRAA